MKLSEFKQALESLSEINIYQSNGQAIAPHFHITEAGLISRHFIDCGGKVRTEKYINFQIWVATDTEHRLSAQKLIGIIDKFQSVIDNEDLNIEIEYQEQSVSRYGLSFDGENFHMKALHTDCLAKDSCGTPKKKIQLAELGSPAVCCITDSNCC